MLFKINRMLNDSFLFRDPIIFPSGNLRALSPSIYIYSWCSRIICPFDFIRAVSYIDYCTYSCTSYVHEKGFYEARYREALAILTIPRFRYIAFIANPRIARGACKACIYSGRNLRARRRAWNFPIGLSGGQAGGGATRRGASLWKLGRNWPEFNPGIQFAVVFVPRGVNPIDARIWQTFSRSNLRLPEAYFPVCSASCEMNGKRSEQTSKLSH